MLELLDRRLFRLRIEAATHAAAAGTYVSLTQVLLRGATRPEGQGGDCGLRHDLVRLIAHAGAKEASTVGRFGAGEFAIFSLGGSPGDAAARAGQLNASANRRIREDRAATDGCAAFVGMAGGYTPRAGVRDLFRAAHDAVHDAIRKSGIYRSVELEQRALGVE